MLTERHKFHLISIQNGADIFDHTVATELREIEEQCPEYIDVTEPMGFYTVDDQLPKFGAIAKPAGLEWATSSSANSFIRPVIDNTKYLTDKLIKNLEKTNETNTN